VLSLVISHNLSQVLIQEVQDVIIGLRSALVEVQSVARARHQMAIKSLCVTVERLGGLSVDAWAVAVADDLVGIVSRIVTV
jgi:hypothetical protein